MSEKEERALGAGTTMNVGEEEFRLRPVSVQHLCDLEREALKYGKRQYLLTFVENADLIPNGNGQDLIERKMELVATWDLDDLPKKKAFDVSRIPVNDKLKGWAEKFQEEEAGGGEEELTDARILALLVTALDQEKIKIEEVKTMTGKFPKQGRIRYDQWWVTGAMEGMVSFLYNSIRLEHPDMTKDKVRAWPIPSIFEGARKVEAITSPAVGNG